MKIIDVKSGMPLVHVAKDRLIVGLKYSKTEKIVKILHGYGASGVGGGIKTMVHDFLEEKLRLRQIEAYIPGEAFFQLMGYDETIRKYNHLLKSDSDYKKKNDGITYVVL